MPQILIYVFAKPQQLNSCLKTLLYMHKIKECFACWASVSWPEFPLGVTTSNWSRQSNKSRVTIFTCWKIAVQLQRCKYNKFRNIIDGVPYHRPLAASFTYDVRVISWMSWKPWKTVTCSPWVNMTTLTKMSRLTDFSCNPHRKLLFCLMQYVQLSFLLAIAVEDKIFSLDYIISK